jgi:hypothetical protein
VAPLEASREDGRARVAGVSCFETLAEAFARDIDRTLLRRALAKTPTERIEWLEQMQALAEEARTARAHEATRAAATSR